MKPFDIEQIEFRHRLQNVIQRAYEETMGVVQSMPMSHDGDNDAKYDDKELDIAHKRLREANDTIAVMNQNLYDNTHELYRLKDVIRIHENTIKNQSEMLTQNEAQHKRAANAHCTCINALDSLRERHNKLAADHAKLLITNVKLTKDYEFLSTSWNDYKQSIRRSLESLV